MKGVSAVIATLLMLIITVALAGLAYTYISSMFTSRTAAVLTVDESSYCNSTHIIVAVRNDGTSPAKGVTILAYDPNGNKLTATGTVDVPAGGISSTAINRGSSPAGTYTIILQYGASRGRGTVYCVS